MIPNPEDILKKFTSSIIDCNALFFHCLNPIAKHTDAGIEAAFLQLVKSWESFLEDCTLILLCGKMPISGNKIQPRFTLSNIEDVRKIIYNGNRFVDWINYENLIPRFKLFFEIDSNEENHLTIALKQSQTVIKNIRIIRNEIAHSSLTTETQIKQLYKDFDPIQTFTRPSYFLKEFTKTITNKTNFVYYSESLELTSKQILG
ncbi:MAG: hypothetical protein ABI741_07725 [Ferruginibacter sp.]